MLPPLFEDILIKTLLLYTIIRLDKLDRSMFNMLLLQEHKEI